MSIFPIAVHVLTGSGRLLPHVEELCTRIRDAGREALEQLHSAVAMWTSS